jgi:AcrR family transcriptional regulator
MGGASAAATDGPAEQVPLPGGDGRSTRWDDHREARRADLVQTARRVVHHLGPDVSMDDIAAAAGTSKSIVYRYFTDKQGLQVAVAEAVVADIRAALADAAHAATTPREALRQMVATYLAMIDSSPHVYTFVTRDGSEAHLVGSITGLLADPFVREVTASRPDPDPADPADLPARDRAHPDRAEWRALPATPGVSRPSSPLGSGGGGGDAGVWAQVWAAGAVGFVRGAGERWLADRASAVATGSGAPDGPDAAVDAAAREAAREAVASQVAAWLWAGPVGMLSRTRTAAPAPVAPVASAPVASAPAPGAPAPAAPATSASAAPVAPATSAPATPAPGTTHVPPRVDDDAPAPAPNPGEHA